MPDAKPADSFRVASWNVNSVRQRLPALLDWLRATTPDVVCLQELKCQDEAFPTGEVEALGYTAAVHGQKGFNGVALLSRHPLEDVRRGLPGDEADTQSRYVEGVVSTREGVLRVASIYLPNGNPAPGEKYAYKLAWMKRLKAHAARLRENEEPLVLAGDFNVIPTWDDAHDAERWTSDALFLPESRAAFRELLHLGFLDALRAVDGSPERYTFWDYQGGAWQKNDGIRIDHLLLSPQAAGVLVGCEIDASLRAGEKPSDHVPIRCDLAIAPR